MRLYLHWLENFQIFFNYAKYESENYMQNPMSNNMHAFNNTNSAPSHTNHPYVFSHIYIGVAAIPNAGV